MALKDIIIRRLEKALTKIAKPEFDIGPNTVLGGPAPGLGFDGPSLRQVLDELNRNEVGFGDLLARKLIQDEVRVSTKVSELATAILQKSSVKDDAEYEVKITERVRIGLRQAIAAIAGIDEKQVVPTDSIDAFLPRQQDKDRLRQSLAETLDKYLFSTIITSDIQGTVGRIQRRIVNRMML